MVYSDGSVYIGGWKDFKYHGYGKLLQEGGVVFEGEWREGRMHGSGRLEAPKVAGDGAVEGGTGRAISVGDQNAGKALDSSGEGGR